MSYRFTDPRRLKYQDGGGTVPTEIPESEIRWGRAVSGHEQGVRWGQLHAARQAGDDTAYARSGGRLIWAFPVNFEEDGQ